MKYSLIAIALTTKAVTAFPFVSRIPGVDSSLFTQRQQSGSAATCPYNPNHVPAAPITDAYPYNHAINGQIGNEKGGYLVPAPGDKDHEFRAPRKGIDIRGPCPGLNAAANHNFIARDGITTYNELMDAQQNLYDVGYDLANLLTLLGLTLTDGDIVTEKLSIGCDATSRTSFSPLLTGSEPGLNGHNKFESDTSLTRNDFFLANGDDYSFSGTLFKMMTETTGANYDRDGLALYRYQRYQQSLSDNPNFYFGPFSLLIFGASSFLYELMPSGTKNYIPDYDTISSFFGASQQSDGSYTFNGNEQIPPNWINRVEPYTVPLVIEEILAQYLQYPVLFGGKTSSGTFDAISYGPIENGKLDPSTDASILTCFLYQLLTERVPSSLNGILTPTASVIAFVLDKVGITMGNLGCPTPLNI